MVFVAFRSAGFVHAVRALVFLATALAFACALDAQRKLPGPPSHPPAHPSLAVPGGGGIEPVSGDSPLTHLETFSGSVDLFVQVLPYEGGFTTGGTFSVAGVPGGATILRAWVQLTSFDTSVGRSVALTFAGVPQGARLADAIDVGGSYQCSMYRFDVTHLITGNGAYAYGTGQHPLAYGDSLIVVYAHVSLPERTIAIHDGSESLSGATTTTTFAGMPAGAGELMLFTQADETNIPGGESVRLNSILVAGGEIFSATAGNYASLLTLPVTTNAGDNELSVTTGGDWFGFHLAVLSAEGAAAVTLDFETDDVEIPLVNGQDIQGGSEFGFLVDVDGTSSVGLRAAIFDSTPGGPNDPSQDLDLLVGLGNVLILQGQPTQSVPGTYDRPNDDAGGGSFTFDFLGGAATALALDLIDIDPGPDSATVRLIDGNGRRRTYFAPGGWTEDLLAHGPPAYRTLDLTILAPQPGFLASATATEDAGFDPDDVRTIHVVLGGSGALDNLVFRPRASARTVDFEDLGLPTNSQINVGLEGIQSGGFLFQPTLNSPFQDIHAGNNVGAWVWNGTTILAGHREILMTRAGGGSFSLARFDFAGWLENAEGPLTLLASNGAVAGFDPDQVSDGVGGDPDFETFVLPPGFSDITSVLFLHTLPVFSHTFALDNLHVRVEDALLGPLSAGPTPAGKPTLARSRLDPCLEPQRAR